MDLDSIDPSLGSYFPSPEPEEPEGFSEVDNEPSSSPKSRSPAIASTSAKAAPAMPSSTHVIELVSSDEDQADKPFPALSKGKAHGKSTKSNGKQPAANASKVGLTDAEQEKLDELDAEIKSVSEQVSSLQEYKATLLSDRQQLTAKQASAAQSSFLAGHIANVQASTSKAATNFLEDTFAWKDALKAKVKKVWNIDGYRSVQEGILNAVVEGRDCVSVMPTGKWTGAGKSLTYQAPALLLPGTTVVISPLLSLASDQVFHLQAHGIEALALNSATPKYESTEVLKRLAQGPKKGEKEIKLIYVTPEKIVKSKSLSNAMQKAYDDNRLARIAIDEAHCCSSLGHDYRPDYSKLGLLKNLWPETPILATSATCPPKVMENVLKILKLKATTSGEKANSNGTVLFSTPLFRGNLHYQVVPRPSQAQEAVEMLSDWILEKHPGQCGIVYCLSQNDCQKMAQGLRDASDGQIKSAVYHAGMFDQEKERVHIKWREGSVSVICATTAFGMGIDKPDVRFVAHATPPKSFEGLYQESGRAGRDGAESDCIVWYRPGQDVSRLSSLTMRETDGTNKVLDLIGYLNDFETCRKALFARYFREQYATDSDAPCANCDNCTRNEESKESRSLPEEVWRIVQICNAAYQKGGRLSFLQLCDLVRGLGGGTFGTADKKGRSRGSKDKITVDDYGGKVRIAKDETELLLAQLLADRVLGLHFTSNAYSDLAYLCPGKYAQRWLRVSQDDAATMIYDITLPAKPKKESKSKKRSAPEGSTSKSKKAKKAPNSAKMHESSDEEDDAAEVVSPHKPFQVKKTTSRSSTIDVSEDEAKPNKPTKAKKPPAKMAELDKSEEEKPLVKSSKRATASRKTRVQDSDEEEAMTAAHGQDDGDWDTIL